MDYAPIVIGTLNRFKHFKETIESLEKNKWAQYTNVYIGVDHPTKEEHLDGYSQIIDYVKNHSFKFNKTNIIIRKENFGVARNYDDLRELAFKENGMVISTEDDNVFSPNFIEYCDTMLNLYRDSKEVIAIGGYSYPIDWKDCNSGYVLNKNFFSAWGWATWKVKWEKVKQDITSEYLIDIVQDEKRIKKIRTNAPKSFFYLTRMVGKKQVSATDVTISIYMVDNDYCCVMPKISMVRNCGWDGSGVNCDRELIYDPQKQVIDKSETIQAPDIRKIGVNVENMEKLNKLFAVQGIRKVIPYLIVLCIRIIGVQNYCRLRNRVKGEREK